MSALSSYLAGRRSHNFNYDSDPYHYGPGPGPLREPPPRHLPGPGPDPPREPPPLQLPGPGPDPPREPPPYHLPGRAPAPARYESRHHVTSPAHLTSIETAPPASGNIDWKETQTEHVFKVDLPGLRKEEVVVDLEDNRVVKVTWEKWTEREDGTDPWRRVERTCQRFVRSLRLPEDSKPHLIKACMEGGVLTIRVPREEMWMNRRGVSTRITVT